jgi:hypothetical protein
MSSRTSILLAESLERIRDLLRGRSSAAVGPGAADRDGRIEFAIAVLREERHMSKGMDRKKEGKKKPAKSFDEKRAAKREKRQSRGR